MFKRLLNVFYSPKWLLTTNCLTGVLSMAVGDSLQQRIDHKLRRNESEEFSFDRKRNLQMMSCGLYFGTFGHFWYRFLDNRFPGRHLKPIINKLTCEVLIGPPLVGGVFLLVNELKGKTFIDSLNDLKSNFALICSVEWLVYIPLQSLNFKLLAPKFRYLFVAVVSVIYDAFLSFVIHRNERLKQIQ